MIELPYKLAIDLIDTDDHRNLIGSAHVILGKDRILYEAIGSSDWYFDEDYSTPPKNLPYYIRQQYKKEYVAGVDLSGVYYAELKVMIYVVMVNIVGSQDDIRMKFAEKRDALSLYKTINEWIFQP